MGIQFACTCGQKIHAPDGAAGKRAKCPNCGTPLRVPGAAEEAPAPPAEPVAARREVVAEPAARETRPCPACAEPILVEAKKCRHCGEYLDGGRGSVGRRRDRPELARDLPMEGHLQAIAVWYRIGALLVGVGGTLVLCAGMSGPRMGRVAPIMAFAMAFILAICALFFTLGQYLHKFSNAARIVAAVVTGLSLAMNLVALVGNLSRFGAAEAIGNLFQLAYSSAVLWALVNSRAAAICTPGYAEAAARQPGVKANLYASPFFWLPLAAMCLVFGLGFLVAMSAGGGRF